MAKKKVTIKDELDRLNKEAAQEALQQQVVAPVAPTDYTGVQGVVGQPSAYDAAYAAEKARIDAAVANGPLFAGQTGAVGSAAQQRAMEQGLYPNVAQAAGGNMNPGVEHSVEQLQPIEGVKESEAATVGDKVRAAAMQNGLYGPDTGAVGEQAKKRAMQQGLYPDIPEVPIAGESGVRPSWDEGLFSPYQKRIGDLEAEQQQVVELDAEMQRREDARKRIVALGDAFASFANLIGTAHGAENQKQTYASPLVADTIDRSRAVRINRMQQIRKNLDDQRDALIAYQIKNDPNYLPNRQAQERIDAQRGNQQLQYDKLAQTAAHQGNQDQLARDKFDYQQEKDAATRDLNERKFKDTSARGWSNYNLSRERFNYQQQKDAAGGASGGGWSKNAEGNYNAMKTEVARRAGFNTWEEFNADPRARSEYSKLINDMNDATSSPSKQKAVMSAYAEQFAPDFFDKYYLKEQKQTSSGSSGKKANPMGPVPKKKKANPMN